MMGCGRARSCGSCGRDVYDIASLSAEDAMAVLGAGGEPSRTRLYVRHDGSVMRTDCPVGVRRKRVRRVLFAALAVLTCAALAPWPPPQLLAGPTEADFRPIDHADPGQGPVQASMFGGGVGELTSGAGCRRIECESELLATIPLPAAVSDDALRQSNATLCLNRRCYSADLAAIAEGSRLRVVSFPRSAASASEPLIVLVRNENALQVNFLDRSNSLLHDGDVFDLTMRPKAGGPPLVRWRERAAYSVYQPNGSDCGPTCRVFRVDRTKR
jgi:hypothetical protein